MSSGEVLLLVLFSWVCALAGAWAVVYAGNRTPWPCMETVPCYECQLEHV